MGSTASIVWDVFFGIVGSGYFLYGKKQQAIPPLLCGFGLMIFPYFVSSTFLLVIVGAALMAVPFVFRE
jgi:hypothetical protein